jgi:hypothetical protein
MEDYILRLKILKPEIKITLWFIADACDSPARSLLH